MPEMPSPGSASWVAIAAVLVGLVVRLIKADALSATLTKFFRPDGPPIAIPTRLLPWLALGFGFAAAALDARVAGESWATAAQSGVMAAALAVLGHELGSGLPGVKKVLGGILIIGALSASTTSCGFLEKHGPAILDALFEKTQCAIANMHLPNEEIFVRCALTAEDRPHVEAALGAAREAAVREAMAARYDERQYLLGTGACVDAGANSISDQ